MIVCSPICLFTQSFGACTAFYCLLSLTIPTSLIKNAFFLSFWIVILYKSMRFLHFLFMYLKKCAMNIAGARIEPCGHKIGCSSLRLRRVEILVPLSSSVSVIQPATSPCPVPPPSGLRVRFSAKFVFRALYLERRKIF